MITPFEGRKLKKSFFLRAAPPHLKDLPTTAVSTATFLSSVSSPLNIFLKTRQRYKILLSFSVLRLFVGVFLPFADMGHRGAGAVSRGLFGVGVLPRGERGLVGVRRGVRGFVRTGGEFCDVMSGRVTSYRSCPEKRKISAYCGAKL